MNASSTPIEDRMREGMDMVERLHPGDSTATEINVTYRLGKLQRRGLLHGTWLDCGCADGGFAFALARWGAERVVGVDVAEERIARARLSAVPSVDFRVASGESLPFPDGSFDNVLCNEVIEHVVDDRRTLREIWRVLRPGGHLALMAPNRLFPFDGHGMRLTATINVPFPPPLLPWLPTVLTGRFLCARHYWPSELRDLARAAGFEILEVDFLFPMFDRYAWLPEPIVRWYRSTIHLFERTPIVRRFGLSTFILAQRPFAAPGR